MFPRVAHRIVRQLYAAKKNAEGNDRTERMLTRLIRMTVETGVVTAAAASLDLGLFLGFNDNNMHTLLYGPLVAQRWPVPNPSPFVLISSV